MAKDLIIGGASNYSWKQLKYWVNSIKASGFKGDIVIVATNIDAETINKLTSLGVKVSTYGTQKEDGSFELKNTMAPHVERFFWIWNHLRMENDYRYVVVTDTRDVIFQKNPTPFLEEYCQHRPLIASSEGLLYKDEPWGFQNAKETFGPFFNEMLKETIICNVGTIAGKASYVRDMLLMIFQMSLNRPIQIVDQAVYNFLLNLQPYIGQTAVIDNGLPWAIQLGTTRYAIEAGAGDIGKKVVNDPAYMKIYESTYQDSQPIIEGDKVTTPKGEEYCIVHQYDRVPSLFTEVVKKYGA